MGAKRIVQDHFTIANGYPTDAKVIYGDTDSIMIHWGPGTSVEKAESLSAEACALINAEFPPPCCIVFEKTFMPYLLLAKKRYAGRRFMNGKIKLAISGMETGRRDNCPLLPKIMERCLDLMLMQNDWKAALAYAEAQQRELLHGRVPITDLIITNELRQDPSAYKTPNEVATLTLRMRRRDPSTAPNPGDRVPFVIVAMLKGTKKRDRVEDPLYVVRNGIRLDYAAYNTEQLAKPLFRIFQFCPGITESHFANGPHTRIAQRRSMAASSMRKQSIASFFKPRAMCICCGASMPSSSSSSTGSTATVRTCVKCRDKEARKVAEETAKAVAVRQDCIEKWAFCANCAGSKESAEQCVTRECPRFYNRYIARLNLKATETRMEDVLKILDW